jgi:hypothetical protein
MNATDKRQRFLQAFALTGVVGEAARLAKVDRSTHYHVWMQDPEYQRAFADAREEAADRMEAELMDRVYNGTEEPIVYQGEVQRRSEGTPVTIRRKNDILLMFSLKALRPDKFRDNVKAEIAHSGSLTVTRDPQMSRLSDEQLTMLEAITLASTTATDQLQ